MFDDGHVRPGMRPKVSGQGNYRPVWSWLRIVASIFIAAVFFSLSTRSAPSFDTSNAESFFTNVAARLLSSELNVDLTHIEVYPTNLYSPSVHRLLQVTANIYDATTTNFYPSVFRPIFTNDGANVFICGYQQIISVSPGFNQPSSTQLPLSQAVDVSYFTGQPPGIYSNNVYGVPWIIGVKKGLPGLNQFSMVNSAQFTRRLQVAREAFGSPIWTNQMILMGITNNVGISFWNSYNNDYPTNYPGSLNLSIYVSDTVQMDLTNSAWGTTTASAVFSTNFVFYLSRWPGSRWYPNEMTGIPASSSFVAVNWANTFIPQMLYQLDMARFTPTNVPDPWETNLTALLPLPQFGLETTNWLQAIIVDNTNVIDYVQLKGPTDSTNLTSALADPDFADATGTYYLWSTNQYAPVAPSWGVVNQINISSKKMTPPISALWSNPPNVYIPGIGNQITAQRIFFASIMQPGSFFQYVTDSGISSVYTNVDLAVQAPYSAIRTIFVPYLYQANDPLVHYQVSDLDVGRQGVWYGSVSLPNGLWAQDDGIISSPMPASPGYHEATKGHYQPWGKIASASFLNSNYNFTSAYNLTYKDPLVWGPDYWSFPTDQTWSLNWIGQVHRGTPWQTIYLKAHDVLHELSAPGVPNSGTNTWMAWTGNYAIADAALTAPVNDWQLVSDLSSLLNTNDLSTQLSIDNPNLNSWASLLDGITVLTNTLPRAFLPIPPQFASLVISSNSSQATQIVNAIGSPNPGHPTLLYTNIGDVLAVLQLSEQSPYLNWTNAGQQQYGISDEAYEAIPSQLLPLLRADSIGSVTANNGQTVVQFSGYDGHVYAIQASSDLVNWTSIGTNSPINGSFNFTVSTTGNSPPQFYRTLLLQ